MDIIAFLLCLFLLIISLFFTKKNKLLNPTVLFFALWTFILFLSMLNLYNIYKPIDEVYFLIIIMLIFFFIGSSLGVSIKFNKIIKKASIKINYIVFYMISFFIIFFNIIDLLIILRFLKNGTPMWQIRNWSLQPFGSNNPLLNRRSFLEEIFRTLILTPFGSIIPPVTAYCFFYSKDKKFCKKLLFISLLILITSSLSGGGGRLAFIYYFACFFLAYTMFNKILLKETIKKYRKVMLGICILSIVIVISYTTLRTGKGNFFKQIYTYFALPPTLLSIWLPQLKELDYTYGLTTFFGLHSYFFRFLETIGLKAWIPKIYYISYNNILNAEIFEKVGYGIGNAFVTPIYYFYADGGYFFVIMASFLFGNLVSSWYKKINRNINVKTFTIYSLIIYGIFLTFMRIQTCIPSYIISFFIIKFVFLYKKE